MLTTPSYTLRLMEMMLAPEQLQYPKEKEWMLLNMLKLNGDKTEFIQFLPNHLKHIDIPFPSVTIGSDSISASLTAKNSVSCWMITCPLNST